MPTSTDQNRTPLGSPRRRRRLYRLAALCLAVCFCLALAESALRLKGDVPRFPRFLAGRRLPDGTLIRQNQPGSVYWHASPDGQWEFRINGNGFRNDQEFTHARSGDRARVLCLGDSFTMGYEVAAEQTWSWQLQGRLEQITGRAVEVLNAGVSGFGTAEEYAFLEGEGFRFQPDLIVVGVYANDYQDSTRSGLYGLEDGQLIRTGASYAPGVLASRVLHAVPGHAALAQRSHVYALLNERSAMFVKRHLLRRGTPQEASDPPDEDAVDLVIALLERIVDDSATRGVPVVLLDIASGSGVAAIPQGRLQQRPELHVVESATFYPDCCAADGVFREHGHGHWTPSAHAAAARAIAALAQQRGWLRARES